MRFLRKIVIIQTSRDVVGGPSCHTLRVKAKAVVLGWILTVA